MNVNSDTNLFPDNARNESSNVSRNFKATNKVILATAKSKSGNASVGMTIGIQQLKLLNSRVGKLKSFEMVEGLVEEELKYGKHLFADPKDTPFVDPEFMDPTEPNTDQEKKILKALQDYFKIPKNDIDIKLLNKLYDLRDKFPKLLKPTDDVGYRGATMGLEIGRAHV